MEHGAFNEELGRFLIAVSAAEDARLSISLIDGPLPEGQRQYLYATPDKSGQFRNDDLDNKLSESKTPYLVNWDRDSESFGLRYVQSSQILPKTIRIFTGADAENSWRSWRNEKARQNDVLSRAASYAIRGSALSFLDDVETNTFDKKVSRGRGLEI